MRKLSLGLSVATMVMFAACGDENTTNITENTGMMLIEKGEKMPDCTTDNAGELVYFTDSAAAFFCADGKWQSLKGEKGDKGDEGKPGVAGVGEKGEPGTNGTNGASGASCTAVALEDGSGYKVVCGGDSVGVVLNGTNGTEGASGTSCTAVALEDGSGYKVVCGGDSVGVVLNGVNGTEGASGTSCTAVALEDGSGYKIECDGDSVGVVLNGKDGGPGADGKSFVDGWMVDPRDKQLYRTVTIGDQIWMAENLNYRYLGPTADEDSSSFCCQNDPANCAKYGRLYLWSATMDSAGIIDGNTANGCGYQSECSLGGNVRGVCPEGWHLPGYEDWETLIVTVDGSITGYDRDNTAGSKLRSSSGWNNNGNGTDDYRFSALPAGYWADCFSSGHFAEKDYGAYFWSSTEVDSSHPYNMVLGGVFADLNDEGAKCHAFSVRCLKD